MSLLEPLLLISEIASGLHFMHLMVSKNLPSKFGLIWVSLTLYVPM